MAASPNEDLQWQTCEPSDALTITELTNLFRALSTEPTEEIQSNLCHLLKRFMERCRSTTTNEEKLVRLKKCCYESIIWYDKMLDSLLQEDRQHAGLKNVSSFLKEPWQSCLMVCCLEITLYTNKFASDFDPQLLQTFSLSPYNFWKVINLVLHTKIDLTLDVTKHLLKVEEMIVESLVWTRDSPLWEDIRANQGQMPTCHQLMLSKGQEDLMTKEKPDHILPQVELSPDLQNSSLNRPLRNGPLYMFACKVYRLMHKQLTTLCSSLNLQEDLQRKIWTCFECSLVHHLDMLQDRPLHWLLLCAIYDLTKDIRGISFRQIINCYKSQHINKNMQMLSGHPETSLSADNNYHRGRLPTPSTPSVHDKEEDAIATFYNQVYTPVMGQFINKFAPASGTETPPLSPYPTPPPASSRKYRLRPGSNVFVSQLDKRTTPQQAPSGMGYVFQSSPSQRFNEINTMMRCKLHSKRALTFIPGEDDRDEEAGPSAKMPRTSSESILHRKLQDVEDDRRRNKEQDRAPQPLKHLYI